MPLARTYDPHRGVIATTLYEAYLDRLSKWSDIQEYLPFFYELARTSLCPTILELGTRSGNSTIAFLAGARESEGHVWSGDIAEVIRNPVGMLPWKDTPEWTFICGDDMDPEISGQFPELVDIFFLDTSHEYEHTLAELREYMPRVAPGGIALFHDTKLYDWAGYDWRGGKPPVAQALDDYCKETGLSWRESDIEGTYGLGIIEVG